MRAASASADRTSPPIPGSGSPSATCRAATRQLLGCALPDGKLNLLATSGRGRGYTIRQIAGGFALLDETNTYSAGTSTRTTVEEIAAGERFALAVADTGSGGPSEVAEAAFVRPSGSAIAANTVGDTVSVVTLSVGADRSVLDFGTRAQLPPASLSLHGATASWTNDGTPHTATLE